jgi:uncharacterized protein YdhG (YjbR/CyaY superfamily)
VKAKPKTIDEYLAGVGAAQRAALEKLRKTIQAAAPQAEEYISYGVAAFRLNGRPLVAFGASANHCAFFPMDSTTVAAHQDQLKDYDTSKGTIRFQPDRPLPAALVRKLIKARIAGHEQHPGTSDKKTRRKPDAERLQTDPAVTAFLRKLHHPLKKDIEAVRRIILAVSPAIREGIKWNGPSFRTTEYFATVFLREQDKVQLIFHKGGKVKDNSTAGAQITDPAGLIKWLARERCLVTLGVGKDIQANRSAFETIVREWIRQL